MKKIIAILSILALMIGCQPKQSSSMSITSYEALLQQANNGNQQAQIDLGFLYLEGNNVPFNPNNALLWWEKAASGNNTQAAVLSGVVYLLGIGRPENPEKAAQWWQKAADLGDPKAQFALGSLYIVGLGVLQDYQKAENLLLTAAQNQHVKAQSLLGFYYAHGLFLKKDDEKATFWLNKAINQGDEGSKHVLQMLKSDRRLSDDYLQRLSNRRIQSIHALGKADWRLILGDLYLYGDILPKDYHQAEYWWLKAANDNNALAQLMLGLSYINDNKTLPYQPKTAVYWLQRAVKQGNVEAMTSLGTLYASGSGVERNWEKAKNLLTNAGENGSIVAGVILSSLYVTDQIPDATTQDAYIWLNVALKAPYVSQYQKPPAIEAKLKALADNLTVEQRQQAQRKIDDIFAAQQTYLNQEESRYTY